MRRLLEEQSDSYTLVTKGAVPSFSFYDIDVSIPSKKEI